MFRPPETFRKRTAISSSLGTLFKQSCEKVWCSLMMVIKEACEFLQQALWMYLLYVRRMIF